MNELIIRNADRIVNKVISGRWLMTTCCCFVFAWAVVNKLINEQAAVVILTMVFKSYFDRADRNGEEKQT